MTKEPAYKSLIAWQRADALFIRLHHVVISSFPRHDRFVLGDQLRRAALSVPANMVEGISRSHQREKLQFLRIAWASLREADYYVHVAHRLGYLDDALRDELDADVRRTAAPLMGLIKREQHG
jgi:four helix bundle protein